MRPQCANSSSAATPIYGAEGSASKALSHVEPELDNARAAFAWARAHEPVCAVALCGSLLGACPWPSIPERLAMWQAIEPLLTSRVRAPLRARAAFEASTVASNLQGTATRAYVELAVRQFRELGDGFMLYRALAKLVRLIARQDAAAANAALTEKRTLEDPAWPAIRLQRGAEAETSAAFDDPHKALERSYRLMALEDEAGTGMLARVGVRGVNRTVAGSRCCGAERRARTRCPA